MDEVDNDSEFLIQVNQEQLQLTEDDYEKIVEELEIETLHNNVRVFVKSHLKIISE